MSKTAPKPCSSPYLAGISGAPERHVSRAFYETVSRLAYAALHLVYLLGRFAYGVSRAAYFVCRLAYVARRSAYFFIQAVYGLN